MSRIGRVERAPSESKVVVEIDLDGTGQADISTGVRFFDHMLDALGKHGAFDLTVQADGRRRHRRPPHRRGHRDRARPGARARRWATRRGIRRFGDALIPMDEALAHAAVDVSGRPVPGAHRRAGDRCADFVVGGHYPTVLNRHVFESLAFHGQIALHVRVLDGPRPAPHHRGPVQGDRPGAAGGGGARPAGARASRPPRARCEPGAIRGEPSCLIGGAATGAACAATSGRPPGRGYPW